MTEIVVSEVKKRDILRKSSTPAPSTPLYSWPITVLSGRECQNVFFWTVTESVTQLLCLKDVEKRGFPEVFDCLKSRYNLKYMKVLQSATENDTG